MDHVVIQLQFHFDSYMHERVSDAHAAIYFDLEVELLLVITIVA